MKKQIGTMSRVLLVCLLAAGAGPWNVASAQQPDAEERRLYQLELLIFRNLGYVPPEETDPAIAPAGTPKTGPRVQFLLMNPLGGADAARILPRESLELDSAWRRLERLAGYEPLLLTGWSQPVWDKQAAPAHEINGGPNPRIDGDVTFYRQRYLHLEIDLQLAEFRFSPDTSLAGSEPIRIHGDRRIRIGETHFFDHPQYGVLARLIRLPEPDSEET